jgi:hypothetical protein
VDTAHAEGGEEAMRRRIHRPRWLKKLRLDYAQLLLIIGVVIAFQFALWLFIFR